MFNNIFYQHINFTGNNILIQFCLFSNCINNFNGGGFEIYNSNCFLTVTDSQFYKCSATGKTILGVRNDVSGSAFLFYGKNSIQNKLCFYECFQSSSIVVVCGTSTLTKHFSNYSSLLFCHQSLLFDIGYLFLNNLNSTSRFNLISGGFINGYDSLEYQIKLCNFKNLKHTHFLNWYSNMIEIIQYPEKSNYINCTTPYLFAISYYQHHFLSFIFIKYSNSIGQYYYGGLAQFSNCVSDKHFKGSGTFHSNCLSSAYSFTTYIINACTFYLIPTHFFKNYHKKLILFLLKSFLLF